MKILISTTSFGAVDRGPLKMLEENGFEMVMNPHGRKLSESELVELARGCVGIIAGTEAYTEKTFQKLPQLKAISRCGAGLDGLDLEAARKAGVEVMNTPDAPTQAVAELAVALMLDCLRKISSMDRKVRGGAWKKEMGNTLSGKTVGIVGLGRIGKRVAELVAAFGATLLAHDAKPDEKWARSHGIKLVTLEELLKNSDIVTLHIPSSKENNNLINSERISAMKKGAVLVNTARGGLVDEKALYDAVKQGRLCGAALDVMEKEPYDGPLKELENVVLTPHVGSYATEARVAMETAAAKNLADMLGGDEK